MAPVNPASPDLPHLSTSVSLLHRLRAGPDREGAWEELVRRYGPPIHAWFVRWRAQPADAADLVQDVLVRLVRRMPGFDYDARGSFRSYLKTLARYAWYDLQKARAGPGATGAGGDDAAAEVEAAEARVDLERRLEEEYDRELLAEAMTLVAARVEPVTWEAFRLQAIEGVPAAEVAARLDIRIANAYKARSNVMRRLQETARALEEAADAAVLSRPVQNPGRPAD